MRDVISQNVGLHQCVVVDVHDSGLIDAKSLTNHDAFFLEINIGFTPGGSPSLDIGDHVIVISDGSQHYAMCQINQPTNDDIDRVTVKNTRNDLADLTGEKSLVSSDGFGNQCRVVVSRGGGVIADSGEMCLTHWDPGRAMKRDYFERHRVISPSFYSDHNYNGEVCRSQYKWRTKFDIESINRDFTQDRQDDQDSGNTVTVDIGEEVLEFKTRSEGSLKTSIKVEENGNIIIEKVNNFEVQSDENQTFTSGSSQIEILQDGKISLKTTNGTINIAPDGKIYLGQTAGVDLLTVLKQLVTLLGAAQTVTLLGPQPLLPLNPAGAQTINALLDTIKGSI